VLKLSVSDSRRAQTTAHQTREGILCRLYAGCSVTGKIVVHIMQQSNAEQPPPHRFQETPCTTVKDVALKARTILCETNADSVPSMDAADAPKRHHIMSSGYDFVLKREKDIGVLPVA